jgi:DNA-directed RNA polymerase specialized sigma24 family protein
MDVQQAKQELRQCSYLMLEIENIEELIKRKMQKLDIQSMQLSDMPRSGGTNRDKILGTIGNVEELEHIKAIAYHNEQIQEVELKISRMDKSQERTLLRMRYLQNMQFKEIAYKFNCTERAVHLLHSKSLESYSVVQ